MTQDRRSWTAPAAFVILAAAVPWIGGVSHGLQADDMHLLREFVRVRDALPALRDYFLTLHWQFQYRPLGAYLSDRLFALCWPSVWPMRAAALAVHAVGAVAVLRLGRALGLGPGAACLAGLIFATLPGHAESVLWIATLHGTLEHVLTLWALVLLIEGRRPGWMPWQVTAGVALYMCALATKESGVVGIVLIAAHDIIWRRELAPEARRPVAVAGVYGAMLLALGGFIALRARAYGGMEMGGLNTWDLGFLSSAAVRTVLVSFLPVSWAPVEAAVTPLARTALGQVAALVIAIAPLGVALRFRARRAAFLWVCIGLALGPLATRAVVPSERHLYLSTAFAALLLGLAFEWANPPASGRRRAVIACAVVWLTLQSVTAVVRRGAWRDAARHVSAIAEQTFTVLPELRDGTLLIYLGVPDAVRGAYVLRFGNVGDLIRIESGHDELQAHMACTPAELPVQLLDAPGALQFEIGAKGGHLFWPDRMHGGAFQPYDDLLVERALLGRSFLLLDWMNAGKPAHVLVYDAASRSLQLADATLQEEVAWNLYTFRRAGAPPVGAAP